MHLCMDSSTSLVRSSLQRVVILFVSMNKSTNQKEYEHKLTCTEKRQVPCTNTKKRRIS
jgi:hypothetical protein